MLEWTEAESGKKKLRIEKYVMETCGRGLNQVMEFNFLSRERKKNCRQLMLTYFFLFGDAIMSFFIPPDKSELEISR